MAFPTSGVFDYFLGGRPLATRALVTGEFDYFLGGRPLPIASGVAVVYQFVYPTSDVADGSWTNEAGSNVNLYASIDESVTDDADYIKSAVDPSADLVKLGLGNPGTPGAGTWTMTIRHKKL